MKCQPMELVNLHEGLWLGQFIITSTLFGSISILVVETIYPKNISRKSNDTSGVHTIAFFKGLKRFVSDAPNNLSTKLLYAKISSVCTTTIFLIKARKIWFINLMKVLGGIEA